ncbi:protein phosphatase 2C domain-containing protein [Nocardioides panacisoli]|uniref:PP2C family protein-serine/threonine phosphatase n=1 Tax=Nocardioides panacisoli TaxID=627624 RepID=UPI001C632A3F|nr:protein phosphatase 2C domain-containing protein [Nocardioides panacisoli]QYJ05604.1 protein phosphatase 2C domain-containing protein [Nocardioides panacisoli]
MTADELSDVRWSPPATGTTTQLQYSADTHVGQVRAVNEDSFLAGPPVFVVADGMGGYERGDIASAIVVEEFEALVGRDHVAPTDLENCIANARVRIRSLATERVSPGSTVLAAAYVEQSGRGYWAIAHEGDSRAYQWRRGTLVRITTDHSIVQEMVDDGEITEEEARVHPERHVITRALGGTGGTGPEFSLVPVEAGARLLLCSDGLTGELSEHSISQVLGDEPGSAAAVDLLVRRAVEAGGHDNVTVVIVDVVSVGDRAVVEDTLDSLSPVAVAEDTIPSGRRSR